MTENSKLKNQILVLESNLQKFAEENSVILFNNF